MGQEIGLDKWLSMTPQEQETHRLWAEGERAKELEALTYEKSVIQFQYLLELAHHLPALKETEPDNPRGLALVIDPNVRRE